jgi:hypothetical protein
MVVSVAEDVAMNTFKKFFTAKGGLVLEKIMLSVKKDMNDNGAVRVHVVIIYEKELIRELSRMSADHYFRNIDQLTKDHPDKLKIYEWELTAKERIIPYKEIEYPAEHMTPLAGYIFARYSGTGEHRAQIPPTSKKIKIIFEKKNFRIEKVEED